MSLSMESHFHFYLPKKDLKNKPTLKMNKDYTVPSVCKWKMSSFPGNRDGEGPVKSQGGEKEEGKVIREGQRRGEAGAGEGNSQAWLSPSQCP